MDNLTHSLVGLMMARAGLDRGAKGTTAMLVLAANAPDVDTYSFFTNFVNYVEVHRGYTHALAFAPVVALLPLAIVRGYTRTRPTLFEWVACTLAVLSHLVLDWTNVYGTRLMLPFSSEWFHLDITNIFDPLIWLILVVAATLPNLLGLVGSEIGTHKQAGGKRAWAWVALVSVLAYQGWRYSAHDSALGQLNALLYKGVPAKRVYAFPDSFGTFHWRGLIEGEEYYYEVPMEFNGKFTMFNATQDFKPKKAKAVDAARTTKVFQVFEDFNQVPFWRISPLVDETKVELLDLRFGSFQQAGFSAVAMVNPDGHVKDVQFGFGR
ncbi:MAG: metal-dependent hydrolase [Acidobacteriota bacterium]